MTVILLLGTFILFIALDYALNRNKAIRTVPADRAALAGSCVGEFVTGFRTPENVAYHPGHSWLMQERKNMVRVGADEFAAAVAGTVDSIELPKPGQWIRQGQKVLAFIRQGEKAAMVSPTEGEVVAVNEEVLRNPALLRQDPYGKGWLLAVHVPDEESTARNLIPKGLIREWMRESGRAVVFHRARVGWCRGSGWRSSSRRLARRIARG